MPDLTAYGLPHYSNGKAAMNNWEPVFQNQFEVIITPPLVVTQKQEQFDLLIEQVKSVDGIPEVTPAGVIEQKYLYGTRSFSAPVPDTMTADLKIVFEVNINLYNQMYVYETLRDWVDLHFDRAVGTYNYKRDYTGKITILITNKRKDLFRQYDFYPVFINGPMNPMILDYRSDELYTITAQFRADDWKESRIKSKQTFGSTNAYNGPRF